MTTLMTAMKRGAIGKCPVCGKGRLFRAYLKVVDTCGACGHDLSAYPADDGPAYVTILLVGHLVVGPILFFPQVWQMSPWVVLPVTLGLLLTVTLTALPRIKGAFIGLLWKLRITHADAHLHTADRAD